MRTKLMILGVLVSLLPLVSAAAEPAPSGDEYATGRIQQITGEEDGTFEGIERHVQHVLLLIDSGTHAGQSVQIDNGVLSDRPDMELKQGERVVVQIVTKDDGSLQYVINEPYRLPSMLWLTVAFVALSVLLGGWTGILSVAGLGVSILVLLAFVVPRIVAGGDPLSTCLLGCALIACLSLYIAHGFKRRTSVALLATVVTLVLSVVVADIFVHLASLFGMGSEESLYMQMGSLQDVDLRGLLLGGMLLGALGVLDDITTAQCAVVDEVSKANPSLSPAQLREAGASVGREHIASLINTLALAYAGASLPLLLLLDTSSDLPLWATLNSEFLAEEIIRTLVGSMALLLAVPISTYLASMLLRAAPGSKPEPSHGHSHGHHHH